MEEEENADVTCNLIDPFVFFAYERVSDRQNQCCINYVRMVETITSYHIKLYFILANKGV
jgi:hypothetical protein